LSQADCPKDIRLELTPQGLGTQGLDRSRLAVAGIIDEHANGPHFRLYVRQSIAHRPVVGHVKRKRPATCRVQLC
jgi:hypothetical protein